MSTYRLDQLFSPRSVAVIGASPRITSAGHAILKNLRAGGFGGKLHLVNPRYAQIDGIHSVNSVLDLEEAPDLVVIVVPAADVPSVVAATAEKGAYLVVRQPAIDEGRCPIRPLLLQTHNGEVRL